LYSSLGLVLTRMCYTMVHRGAHGHCPCLARGHRDQFDHGATRACCWRCASRAHAAPSLPTEGAKPLHAVPLSCALPPSFCLCKPSARRSHRLRRHHRPSSHCRCCSRCCAQWWVELSTPPPPPHFPRCTARAHLAWSHRLYCSRRAAARHGRRACGQATTGRAGSS
jgi:hypothetical protein